MSCGGSCQMDDNIGSSVNETNIEINTAATTVMPNWWKKRPMMPPIKPTGKNTATMEKVVANTAKPISAVPSSAAVLESLPIAPWRTMFSRTTIASSIKSPTHNESAISVIMLMVKPNRYMKRKVPMSAIGSVRPVITVERHELRKRNTIRIVNAAPSTMVRLTLSTPLLIGLAPSRTTCKVTSFGNSFCSSAIASLTSSTTSIVFCPCAFWMSSASVRLPSNSAALSCSSCPSITRATSRNNTGCPPRRATTMPLKSSTDFMRPWICTTFSLSRERIAPAGSSWFSLRIALIT